MQIDQAGEIERECELKVQLNLAIAFHTLIKPPPQPSADAVPVSARYNLVGDCDGDVGGSTAPSSSGQCQGGDSELGTSTSPCCSNVFGGCGSSNAYAYKEIKTCAEGGGDLVFDVWGPQGCKDKASGLSNNFAAQEWCKDGNTRSGYCWIPYSLQLNNDASTSCFPLDKDRSGQWTGERREREREREAVRTKTKPKVQSNSDAMNAPSFANRFVRRCRCQQRRLDCLLQIWGLPSNSHRF